jgi:hypothetical protein
MGRGVFLLFLKYSIEIVEITFLGKEFKQMMDKMQ